MQRLPDPLGHRWYVDVFAAKRIHNGIGQGGLCIGIDRTAYPMEILSIASIQRPMANDAISTDDGAPCDLDQSGLWIDLNFCNPYAEETRGRDGVAKGADAKAAKRIVSYARRLAFGKALRVRSDARLLD